MTTTRRLQVSRSKPHIYKSPHGWKFIPAQTLLTTGSQREQRIKLNSLAAIAVRRLTWGDTLFDLAGELLP